MQDQITPDFLTKAPEIKELDLQPLPDWLELREAQLVMFSNLAISYRSGHRKQSVMAPTGVGKTYWAAVLFHRILTKNPKARLIFVVPRTTLLNQAYDDFVKLLGIPISVIRGQDERINLALPVQVATIQTLTNRIKKYPDLFKQYDLMICDENHIIFKAITTIDTKWMVGLSATPYTRGLGLIYDSLVKSIPAKQLTEQRIITPLKVLSAQRQIETKKLETNSTGEYDSEQEQEEVIKILGDVLKEYEDNEDMKGRPFIGFAKTIKACVALSETFEAAGYKVAYVHSKMSDEDCEAILDEFKAGEYIGVFSVVKLIEGFNFPEASALLLCTSFAPKRGDEGTPNALGRYIQMFGRVRRSVDGHPEKYALVHDHGENYEKFGHPDVFELGFDELCTKQPIKKSEEKTEKDIKPKVCPSCNFYIEKGRTCPMCGFVMKKHTEIINGVIVEFENGIMVEYDKSGLSGSGKKNNRTYTDEQKIKFFGGLKGYGISKNYKPGWAANKYRKKFGVWPEKFNSTPPQKPNKEVKNFIKAGQIAWRAQQAKMKMGGR